MRRLLLSAVIVATLFVGSVLALYALATTSQAATLPVRPAHAQTQPTVGTPPAPPSARSIPVLSRVTGVPAIKATLLGHIPAFTEADVRAYIHTNPFSGTTSQVIDDSKILFFPSSQAEVLMRGAQTGIGANEIVCYVEFDNINVTLDNISLPSSDTKPPVIHTGHIVFDAKDGNLLMWGGY